MEQAERDSDAISSAALQTLSPAGRKKKHSYAAGFNAA